MEMIGFILIDERINAWRGRVVSIEKIVGRSFVSRSGDGYWLISFMLLAMGATMIYDAFLHPEPREPNWDGRQRIPV